MAFRDILTSLAKDFGVNLSNADDLASLKDDVNRAVRDLHNSRKWPLRYSVRERLVNIGSDNQLVTLPHHVGKVLAIREPETFDDIRIKGFEDRYLRQSWNPPFREFRDLGRAAIKVNLLTYGPLTLTFSEPLDAAVNVAVVGPSESADRVTEIVAFNVGDTTKTTTNNFKDVESIKKTKSTSSNLTVTDLNDVELSVIPNHKLLVTYPVVQVLEPNESYSNDRVLEILYKLDWQPFVELDHTYYGIEDYDNGFYQATKALITQRMGDMSAQDYATAKREALDILASVDSEAENGDKEIYDVPNPLLSMQPFSQGGTNSRWGRFYVR